MSGKERPEIFFTDEARAAYRRWQEREEKKDTLAQAEHNALVIETGDPEMEQLIAALEQGWTKDR